MDARNMRTENVFQSVEFFKTVNSGNAASFFLFNMEKQAFDMLFYNNDARILSKCSK
jgi:hypothetical protein